MPNFSPTFPEDIVTAVLAHMNSDHRDDNIMIVRAFADVDAATATMTALDESAGYWSYSVGGEHRDIRLPWTEPIGERAEIRREIVALYETAHKRLTKP